MEQKAERRGRSINLHKAFARKCLIRAYENFDFPYNKKDGNGYFEEI
ncbi:MAG: hypothetical protein ABIM21_07300 [candidate division WOR-3 bacterium]